MIVFSDDPAWCSEQELFSDDRFMISENTDNRVDLCLMTLCDDFIIANSSFSWWGAYYLLTRTRKSLHPLDGLVRKDILKTTILKRFNSDGSGQELLLDKNKSAFKLKNFPHVYWLNLDSDTDRRTYMENQFKYWEIPNHTRISGYDARGDNDVSCHLKVEFLIMSIRMNLVAACRI